MKSPDAVRASQGTLYSQGSSTFPPVTSWFPRARIGSAQPPEGVRAFVVLLLSALIAWWPLATFTYGVVHGDMLDCWLPWRTFIADQLQHGEWPVWNPYQQMGYPVHADLQGPAWYPEALLIGGTIGQSIYVLQSLVIGYLLVAGMGMYRLAKQFGGDHPAALAVGAAYMLSGFFTAHVMHQYAFISGAWWPWMLAAFLRLLDRPHWRPALEAAVFQFLLLTGGNHTFTIIGAYLMLMLIGVRCLRDGDRRYALRLMLCVLLFAGASLVMACGVLHAWWYAAPFIGRMSGMGYDLASQGPFTWRTMLSLLIPWGTTGGPDTMGTDITMANAHMSLLLLVMLPLAFFRKRSATENVFLVFGAVCLLASFGEALPVHRWLYNTLPGLNVFRFPSYYTYFTLLCWLPPTARSLAQWNELDVRGKRVLFASLSVAFVILVVALLRAAVIQLPLGSSLDDAHRSWYERMNTPSIAERTLVHGSIQLIILLVFAVMVLRAKWFTRTRLALLVITECSLAVMFCSWSTGISDTVPSILHRLVELRPKGCPLPDEFPLGRNRDAAPALQPLWRNTNIFQKRVSHDGFNSFWPEPHLHLAREWPLLFAQMKSLPLVYFADSAVSQNAYVDGSTEHMPGRVLAVLDEAEQPPTLHRTTSAARGVNNATLVSFGSTSLTVIATLSTQGLLVVQQQALPGWKALLNKTPVPIIRVNGCAIGIVLPPGDHQLELTYDLPLLTALRICSWSAFLIILLLLAGTGSHSAKLVVGVVVLFCGLFAFRFSYPNTIDARIAIDPCSEPSVKQVLHHDPFDGAHDHSAQGALALRKEGVEWSPAFELALADLDATAEDALVVEARYRLDPGSGPLCSCIVLTVQEGGATRFYRTRPLDTIPSCGDGWYRTRLIAQVEELHRNRGMMKTYVWNNGAGTVLLDDFTVSVMPWADIAAGY
jgi:hypothetical protein